MRAGIQKYSVSISGHKTSITLEPVFWSELCSLASQQGRSPSSLIRFIDSTRGEQNLSSAIRVYILKNYIDKQKQNFPD